MTPTAQDEIVIGMSDLKRLFYRVLPRLKLVACLSAGVVFCFLLLKEPKYLAQASFKQSNKSGDSGVRLKDIFQGGGFNAEDSATMAVMQSHTVLHDVVGELGLQISGEVPYVLTRVMGRIWDNLAVEMGREIAVPDRFIFRHVTYAGEQGMTFYVRPVDAVSFELLDGEKKSLGVWKLGQRISLPSFSGVLVQMSQNVQEQKLYRLNVSPWIHAVGGLKRDFQIKSFKAEKNILHLFFAHRDRILAAEVLNQIILSYQNYLCRENEEFIGAQLHYLEQRQNELTQHWDEALQEHVGYLQGNLGSGGYLSLHQEMEMLTKPQNLFTSKLFDIDLEMRRLEGISMTPSAGVQGSFSFSEEAKKEEEPGFVNGVQFLKKGFPVLHLPHAKPDISHSLEEKKGKLEQQLIAADREEKKLSAQKISRTSLARERSTSTQQSQEAPLIATQEFAGLTLTTAQTLYLNYNTTRDALQAQLRQLIYLSKEIPSPDFELSSITEILSDPVTLKMVHEASATALQLRDAHNRSLREQEHLREALNTQKAFLSQHLGQTIELARLRIKLIEEKIASLQQTTLELLKQEKGLVKERLQEITEKMEDLPEKWRRENMLMLKKELGMRMVEGMTQLAESKNIDQHLYQVGSKVLDPSLVPLHPKASHLIFYPLFAALFGAMATYFYHLCRSLFLGMPLSHETLLLYGFRSLGKLSAHCNSPVTEMRDGDLETLRRASLFLMGLKNGCCALIGGKNPDYSHSLAELLSLQGLKVLIVPYVFDTVHPDQVPGLWHYLTEEIDHLPIRHQATYDFLPSGGTTRHGTEMLHHPKFLSFLGQVKQRYDLVLLYSKALPQFAEAEGFLNIADAVIVTTDEEKKGDVAIYRAWEEKKGTPCAAFICFEKRWV